MLNGTRPGADRKRSESGRGGAKWEGGGGGGGGGGGLDRRKDVEQKG